MNVPNLYKCDFNGALTFDFNVKNPVSFDYSFVLLPRDNGTKRVYFNIVEEAIV